jgi:acetyltransferase-like isoleucine patch superfamily enzyme
MTPDEMRKAIEDLRLAGEAELKAKWDRSLPFADGLFDRWERARRLGFEEGASIYDSACVFGSVLVGAQTWVGPWVVLDGSGGGIRIGATCTISAGVQIYTHDTVLWALSGGKLPKSSGAVSIGNQVYIGSQSIIGRGATIGDMVLIAANSFVNRDVAPRTIVGGSPARPIGRVECEGENVKLVFGPPTARVS